VLNPKRELNKILGRSDVKRWIKQTAKKTRGLPYVVALVTEGNLVLNLKRRVPFDLVIETRLLVQLGGWEKKPNGRFRRPHD